MADSDIEVTEIESPFLQRAGDRVYSYKFPTRASIVSMEDGTSVQDALTATRETLEGVSEKLDGVADDLEKVSEDLAGAEEALAAVQETLGETTAEELAEAVADAHTHENKDDVLDHLGVSEEGELTFDGEVVGSGESASSPWTAYGDGVDAAPEGLREAGVYVSGETEAPEETAVAAVLRQKREEDLVPIYPRTDGELVSILVEGLESDNVAGAISELAEGVSGAASAAASAQATADAAQATADEALTKAEAGGGEAGEVAVEVEELKTEVTEITNNVTTLTTDVTNLTATVEQQETAISSLTETVEAQAATIANLTEQLTALQSALDGYMPISGDQFTGAYYGTTVAADDGAIDLSKGSIYTAAVSGGAFEVTIEGAVGASCFTLALTCEEDCEVTWPASVRWPDGEAPEVVAGVNVFTFISPDAGTTWYGIVNGANFAASE